MAKGKSKAYLSKIKKIVKKDEKKMMNPDMMGPEAYLPKIPKNLAKRRGKQVKDF